MLTLQNSATEGEKISIEATLEVASLIEELERLKHTTTTERAFGRIGFSRNKQTGKDSLSAEDIKAVGSFMLDAGLVTLEVGSIVIPGAGEAVAANRIRRIAQGIRSFFSRNSMNTLKKNKIAGELFENKVLSSLEKTQSGVVKQVTVKTQNGTRTRIDLMGRNANGKIICTECKSSATAPLTVNQKIAFPEIQRSGGIIVGKGKPGFPGGTVIPPTKVDIIRP